MNDEVEALLVNRVGAAHGGTAEYYIVPIDECFKLVGLIRLNWHGFSGGTEVWREIGKFFAELERASPRVQRRRRMPDLEFPDRECRGRCRSRATPTIAFKLRVSNSPEPGYSHRVPANPDSDRLTRRRYTPAEQARMRDLFGDPDRWSQTLRTMLWTHAEVVVPGFPGLNRCRNSRGVHVRFQRGGDKILSARSTTASFR